MNEYLTPEIVGENELAPYEKEDLEKCEEVILRGIRSFFKVGNALRRIRDLALYRETHRTFEEYMEDRWDYTRQYGYQLIAAAATADNLSTIGRQPENERQIRVLTKLDPDQQQEVWRRACEKAKGGRMSTRLVEEALKEVLTTTVDSPPEDDGAESSTKSGATMDTDRLALKKFGRIEATASKLKKTILSFVSTVGGNTELMNIVEEVDALSLRLTGFKGEWFAQEP